MSTGFISVHTLSCRVLLIANGVPDQVRQHASHFRGLRRQSSACQGKARGSFFSGWLFLYVMDRLGRDAVHSLPQQYCTINFLP